MKISIVIPTWNHLEDLLIPCVNSIEKHTTDKYELEFIFVANGCTDGTENWLKEKNSENQNRYKYFFTEEQIGFTKAANIGFKMANSELVVILNNDIEILDFCPKDFWLDKLIEPFSDEKVAASGPLKIYDNYTNREFIVGFCTMFRSSVLKELNYFDEIFSPAGGEDVDLCIKIQDAGYKIVNICDSFFSPKDQTNVGNYPLWHKDNKSYSQISEYKKKIVKRNGLINCKRHNKNIKLNLGSGGVNFPGYLSVDLFDERAQVIMDITKLDFESNSVEEILASHLFEHLNPYHTMDILKEWLRVLKPGGKLIMELPNIEEVCKNFITSNYQERFGLLNVIYGSVNTSGVGGPDNITSPHLFGWWPESLYNHLSYAGYSNIIFMPEQIKHPGFNMRVEAIKPV